MQKLHQLRLNNQLLLIVFMHCLMLNFALDYLVTILQYLINHFFIRGH